MDENVASSLLYGCKLAKDLEQNLPMLANQPDILLISCEEIVRVFSNIKERLIISQGHIMSVIRQPQELQQLDDHHIGAGIQDWLRTCGTATSTTTTITREPMDLLNASVNIGDMNKYQSSGLGFMAGGFGGEIKPTLNAPDSSITSSSQKQRRRSYYRCTHQKIYGCPAKKQVQRLEDDPFTFEVTYRDTHTCHVSSTASSAAATPPEQRPALPPPTTSPMQPPIISFSSSSLPTTHWLSMQLLRDLGGATASAGGGAGPSAARFPDYQRPVADMADAMFNSASSSSNSMDLIFSSMDDKWDSEEKRD